MPSVAFAHTQDYNKRNKKKTKSTHSLCLGAADALERGQNERDVLEALSDYKCDTGMLVEARALGMMRLRLLT
jgi:hypothetical protein